MSAFSIAPITQIPPPAAQEFPDFIQFQAAGTDLGGPDASTLNFSTGLTATRGVGENSHVVTVSGAGSAPGLLTLTSIGDPPLEGIFSFDGNPFTQEWTASALIPSDDWSWEQGFSDSLVFHNTGIYRVTSTNFIDADIEWPSGNSTFGAIVGGQTTTQCRTHTDDDQVDIATRIQWTDQFILTVTEPEFLMDVGVYGLATAPEHAALFAGMSLVIERLGDAP